MKNFTYYLLVILTIISFTVNAQTHIKGGIYSNTTLTKANSPYIVDSLTVVFPGDTLVIQPGVTVRFADGAGLEIRQGTFLAEGTSSDSITFTSNTSSAPGSWTYVYLDSAIGNRINYCNFLYASNGILTSTTDSLPIRNSTFSYNADGFNGGDNASYYSYLYVDSCIFQGNSFVALTSTYYLTKINHCSFLNNIYGITGYSASDFVAGFGTIENCIFISNSTAAELSNCNVFNCLFDSNGTAISTMNGYDSITNCKITNSWMGLYGSGFNATNCSINHNQNGIYGNTPGVFSAGASTIKNCTIDSNNLVGAYLYSWGEGGGDNFTNNEVKNNGIGIEVYSLSGIGAIVAANDVENDSIGIQLDENISSIYCNKLCGNTSYDFVNNQSGSINISNNYWCSIDSVTIAAHIKDGYDDVSLGLAKFIPIDNSSCYLTGCNLHITATVTNAECDTCHEGSATANVTNGTGDITYTWQTSPIQTTQTALQLSAGTYTVCVTDGKGCTACKTDVYVDSTNCNSFGITATGIHATCSSCADGKAWVDIGGGHAPFSYTWYTSPVQTGDTAINLMHGTYSVCVTDVNGCVACNTVTIGIGNCSAHYELSPTSTPHEYVVTNMASGAAPLSYDWNWGDGSAHDTAATPTHTYASAGFYSIILSIEDSQGCTSTYKDSMYLLRSSDAMITVTVILPNVTAVNPVNASTIFHIAPNPANDHFTLSLPENTIKASMKIYNLLGALEYNTAIEKQLTNIDVSSFAQGIYIVEVAYDGTISRQKFVKE